MCSIYGQSQRKNSREERNMVSMTRQSRGEGGGGPLLRYRLAADPGYTAGQPILIRFTLENMADGDLWVLTWYTPLEGLMGRIFTVTCDGREILYEGMMVKRGDPGSKDYMHISPHGSVSAVVDLSEAYPLHACRECRVRFRGRIHDVVRAKGTLPRKSDDHEGMDIEGNSVIFRIGEG